MGKIKIPEKATEPVKEVEIEAALQQEVEVKYPPAIVKLFRSLIIPALIYPLWFAFEAPGEYGYLRDREPGLLIVWYIGLVAAMAVGCAAIYLFMRYLRARTLRIVIDKTGIRQKSPFRNLSIDWEDLQEVFLAPRKGRITYRSRYGVEIRLRYLMANYHKAVQYTRLIRNEKKLAFDMTNFPEEKPESPQ
jgi:hypothetical protein